MVASFIRLMKENPRPSWILEPFPWIPDPGCWISVFFSGTYILDSIPQWDSGFLQLYSGFQSPGIRIQGAKFSKISDCTSQDFPHSGIRIPLHEAIFIPSFHFLSRYFLYFTQSGGGSHCLNFDKFLDTALLSGRDSYHLSSPLSSVWCPDWSEQRRTVNTR